MKKINNKIVLLAALLGFAMMAPALTEAKDNPLPLTQQIDARGGHDGHRGGGDRYAPRGRDHRGGGMREPARRPQRGPQMPICPQPMPQPMPMPMPMPMAPGFRPMPMPPPPPPMPMPMPMPPPIVIPGPGIIIHIG